MHERQRRAIVEKLAEGGRRAARELDCPRCGSPVIVGPDHDTAALTVTVDRAPLGDRADEMLAILDGRMTFDLMPQRDKPGTAALWIREPWHYHSERDYGGTVHVMHECRRTTLF